MRCKSGDPKGPARYQYEWQHLQAGHYAFAIEPSTNHVPGNLAVQRGEMIWIEHGDERRYGTTFRVLDGYDAIEETTKRIKALAQQPVNEFSRTIQQSTPIGARS